MRPTGGVRNREFRRKTYPEYIGVSDVTTCSFDFMRVEGYMDGQTSILFDEPKGFDIGNPPELQGQSRGWAPVHVQLGALSESWRGYFRHQLERFAD